MRSAAVLAPVVIPLLAAALITLFGLLGLTIGRAGVAAGAWASLLALGAVWIPVRSTQELTLGQLGFGSTLDVRIDSAAFAFGLLVIVPASVLLTFQRRTWQESAIGMLGLASAVAAIEAGDIVLTAIAGGAAATLALVLLEAEDPAAPRPSWATLLAGWLALAWVGVLLQVRGGTAVYDAVPVSVLTPAVFALLAASALIASGLFPWRGWPVRVWSRSDVRAGGVVLATLYPLGFYLLVRAYELGDGRYPHPAFNVALAVVGILVALAAGLRAQAAPSRRQFFAEAVNGFGGLALMSIAMGTPVALVAGLLLLATASALIASLPLLADRSDAASLLAIAVCAGLPPGVAYGGRVLGVATTFEAGDFFGFYGLAAVAVWALWVVASARAVGLPGAEASAQESFPRAAGAIALITMLAGPALAAIAYGFADPVASDVIAAVPVSPATRFAAVVTTSTVLPALTFLLPLLLIALLAYPGLGLAAVHQQARPPLLEPPALGWWTRAREIALAARVPEQYQSLVSLRELEAAASGGRPWLWIATLVALGFAVTR